MAIDPGSSWISRPRPGIRSRSPLLSQQGMRARQGNRREGDASHCRGYEGHASGTIGGYGSPQQANGQDRRSGVGDGSQGRIPDATERGQSSTSLRPAGPSAEWVGPVRPKVWAVRSVLKTLFRVFASSTPSDHAAVSKAQKAKRDILETAAKVRGAALDAVDRSESTSKAIDDLLRRM